mmetsp:Transcript_88816/g.108644  ORF Transcript_88816/g.108644 Transcript_88816/m.108644 type:complete len:417 (+) Transcript_88816:85-1335(+)
MFLLFSSFPRAFLWWALLIVSGDASDASSASKNLRGELRDFKQCGVSGEPPNGRRTKIVHGRNAVRCAHRWQVSIQSMVRNHPWHFCGGTLITPKWVLTAAHCAAEVTNVCQLRKLRVVSGDWKRSLDEGAVTRRVKRMFSSPSYNVQVESDSDFALIELDEPMPITDCIGPACLPNDSDTPGTECVITGWGTVSSSGPLPDGLQEAAVTLVNDTVCAKAYAKQNDTVTGNMMCAAGKSDLGITDSCQGDSGGPLVCEEKGRFVVRGVTSWGEGCGVEGYPGVYARVTSALDWIHDVLDGKVKQSDFEPEDQDFAGAMWKVVEGDCVMDEKQCIMTPGFPKNYTSADYCRIAVNDAAAVPIVVEKFQTENNYDSLIVNCEPFSGDRSPSGIVPNSDIFWASDGSLTGVGWKLCPGK